MNVPFRYDLPNSSSVNKIISILKRKLQKLVKAFPHTKFLETLKDRKLFTNHGLHRNKLRKKLVNIQLAHLLLTTFSHKALHPISLGWYETCNEVNLSGDVNQMKSLDKPETKNVQQESERVQSVVLDSVNDTEPSTLDNTIKKCVIVCENRDVKAPTATPSLDEEPRVSKRKKKPPVNKE
jgi:hypothetical protein